MKDALKENLSDPSPKKGMRKICKIILIIFGVLVMVGVGYYILAAYFSQEESIKESKEEKIQDCSNIDISDWEIYKTLGYTIKYPKDWFSDKMLTSGSGLQWYVAFGPNDQDPLVYIGGFTQYLDEFKQYITTSMDPAYVIETEEETTISGIESTKLTVRTQEDTHPEYFYYIPADNIPIVIKGPKNSESFSNCESQIFNKMIESFKYAGLGVWPQDSSSELISYTSDSCGLSFKYPKDWEVKQNYFYETAEGEKATQPTIVLGSIKEENTTKNYVNINMRQASCAGLDRAAKNSEPIDADSDIYIDFTYDLDQKITCAEIELDGFDKNCKNTTHHFVSRFVSDSGIKEIFKDIIKSYKSKN